MPMTEPPADRRALEVLRADPPLIGTRRLSIEAPSFYGRYALRMLQAQSSLTFGMHEA